MLNINSKTIKDDLMNIHGIKPCKSFNIEFPSYQKMLELMI